MGKAALCVMLPTTPSSQASNPTRPPRHTPTLDTEPASRVLPWSALRWCSKQPWPAPPVHQGGQAPRPPRAPRHPPRSSFRPAPLAFFGMAASSAPLGITTWRMPLVCSCTYSPCKMGLKFTCTTTPLISRVCTRAASSGLLPWCTRHGLAAAVAVCVDTIS
jgi:hypothetical protein